MQVQQPSNVSFGFKVKAQGLRHALKSGLTFDDLRVVRDYAAKLDPIDSIAYTTITHDAEKGLVVHAQCDGKETDSDTVLAMLRGGGERKEKIPNLILLKAMCNDLWLKINIK